MVSKALPTAETAQRQARLLTAARALASERAISYALVLVAIIFDLYFLHPEVATLVPRLNDGVMHLLGVQRALSALKAGQDPTDPWFAPMVLGYPLFHYYQHLPYVLPAVLSFLLHEPLSAPVLFSWTSYLLLSLFPVSIYWSMRKLGFSYLQSGFAGLAAPLIATNGLFGFDLESYTWAGYGLYTQLWGMLLLPPALALGYVALKEGRGNFWAVLLLSATALSHLAFGYMALASLALFALLSPSRAEIWRRTRRLALILVPFTLVTGYFLIPLLLDSGYFNHSVWDPAYKYDSYGAAWVLGKLVHGELFDFGRFPSFTLLAGVGMALCLRRWREERYRVPAVLAVLWLLLYFGRPTWGILFNLTPLSRDLYLHRLIAGVHLGGIFLIGLGLAVPWQWALGRRNRRYLLAPALITLLLLYPVYSERIAYLGRNVQWMGATQDAYASEQKDIDGLLKTLQNAPPGRVYAGLAGQWGKQYTVGAVHMYDLLTSADLDTVAFLYHPWSLNGDVQVLFDESRPEQYDLFNIRYVVAPRDRQFPDFVRPIGDFGRHRLYRVDTTGYFDLVGSDQTFVGDKQTWYPAASSWLRSDLPRAKQDLAIVFGSASDNPSLPTLAQAGSVLARTLADAGPSRGRVVSERVESNAYLATVQVDRPSTLMLKVTYHPNWHAYIDGVETETAMVMPSYVGVKVSPGTHSVRLVYRPQPLRWFLMIVGLLTLLVLAVAQWRGDSALRLARRVAAGRPHPNPLPEGEGIGAYPKPPTAGEAISVVWKRSSGLLPPAGAGAGGAAGEHPSIEGGGEVSSLSLAGEGRGEGESRAAGNGRAAPAFAHWRGAWSEALARVRSFVVAGPAWRSLGLLLVAATALRALLTPLYAYLPGDALDEYAWKRWMQAIHGHGILNIFQAARTDYVGYHWDLWLLSKVYDWFGSSYVEFPPAPGQAYRPFAESLHLLLKVPPLVFDALLIVAVFAATLALTKRRGLALIAASVIALQPAVIYDSAVWAQIDASITAAMLGAIVLIALGRPGWGWGLWALGFMIKPQPIVIAPLLAVLTFRTYGWRGLLRGAAAGLLVAAAVLGPWILHGDLDRIVGIYRFVFGGGFGAERLSGSAWNLWWFWDLRLHALPTDTVFFNAPGFPTYHQVGLALSACAGALALVYLWRRPSLTGALIASAYVAFAFYMLPTSTHERYLFPFLAFLLPVAVMERRWLWIYLPASLAFFLNLVVFAPPIHNYSGRWLDSPLSIAVASVNALLFSAFTFALARRMDCRRLIRATTSWLARASCGQGAASLDPRHTPIRPPRVEPHHRRTLWALLAAWRANANLSRDARWLAALLLAGAALAVVAIVGLLLPGSVFQYAYAVNASEPVTTIYAFDGGQTFLLVTLALLCGCFVLALAAAARLSSRRALVAALAGTALLIMLFVAVYPGGALDLFHNMADARTLWVYGQNPLTVPPGVHAHDPIMAAAIAWRNTPSFYGPLTYLAYGLPLKVGGDDLLANLIAFKALNGLALLILAGLAGHTAGSLSPNRRVQAIVLVGWNPLMLYEVIGNGHNDILMGLPMLAALALACRFAATGSFVALGASVAAKYATAVLAPVIWLWLWLSDDKWERRKLILLALVGAFAAIALYLAFGRGVAGAGAIATGYRPVRSPRALIAYALEPLLGSAAVSVAGYLCLALFAILALGALARLNRTTRSLFVVSFWVLLALTVLTTRQVYPWYLVWFIPLGAVLAGSLAADIAVLASL
ncbi:MAG TPA: YfhO family protein, partial [Dehalococcoidia bacterium]|nr:YfhO family protein [Dehalococcoidia bacterium]